MGHKGFGLLLILLAGMAAALLVKPNQVNSQDMYCPPNGIVPGSVSVTSTNNGAGQVAGHTVRFQLCGGIEGPVVSAGAKPPLKIGLLWETRGQHQWWEWAHDRFLLNNPAAAGITLSAVDNTQVWTATKDISKSASPDRLYHVYSRGSSYGHEIRNFQGVTVEFGPAALLDNLAASADLPLTLQFNVPASAGMSNPENIGEYNWLVVLYHDFVNSCEAKFATATSKIVPAHIPGELQLFPKSGGPGTTITVFGNGFPVQEPVRLAQIGRYTLPWFPLVVSIADPATAINALGTFEFEVVMPGFQPGTVPIEVQVGEKSVTAEFTLVEARSYTPGPFTYMSKHIVEDLGDNFVTAFYYHYPSCRWNFYDPEFSEESDLLYFITGERYWILVKEPEQIVLNRTTRNLTCSPDGNCWNQIVW